MTRVADPTITVHPPLKREQAAVVHSGSPGPTLLGRAARGAIAGFLATFPMTAFLVVARLVSRHERGEIPPYEIVETARRKAGIEDVTHDQQVPAVLAGHFAYGAGAGALYGLLGSKARLPLAGPAYGLLVWAVSYFGWLPAVRLYPPPQQDSPTRTTWMVLAHLVWGTALQVFCGLSFPHARPHPLLRRSAGPRRQ